MDVEFNTLLSVAIIPQVIDLIVNNEVLDENSALYIFYNSKTYEFLSDEETKMWHYSPLTIYSIWKSEQETGDLIWPEE